MLNQVEAIQKINFLVQKNIPFLFIIDAECAQNEVIPLEELGHADIFYATPSSHHLPEVAILPELVKFEKTPISPEIYRNLFNQVLEEINRGNTFLINLTTPTKIETNLNLRELFQIAQAKYRLFYQNEFIVFSPECFIRIEEGRVKSFPMKGTIRADLPNARESILNNVKEAAEHATIVDLIRNDLSMVASQVEVTNYRYLELVNTYFGPIYQVSSQIEGKLNKNYKDNLGEILYGLLPAGSVTGAPKPKTMDIIRKVELCPRGFYTGVFGTWVNNKLDSAVMIRFLHLEKDTLWYHSGGGITFQSNMELEYKEMIDKVYVPVR